MDKTNQGAATPHSLDALRKTESEWVDYLMAARLTPDDVRAAKCIAYALAMWGDQRAAERTMEMGSMLANLADRLNRLEGENRTLRQAFAAQEDLLGRAHDSPAVEER